MQNHGEIMDTLLGAMEREQSQMAALVEATQAAKAQDDDGRATALEAQLGQKAAYLAYLQQEFRRRLN